MISTITSKDGRDIFSAGKLKEISEQFKLFADPTRLQILQLLNEHDAMNVQALCERLGQSQPAVSHHLAMLRLAEVIEMRRSGKFNFYSIAGDKARKTMNAFLDSVFDEPQIAPEPAVALPRERSSISPAVASSGACRANYSACST